MVAQEVRHLADQSREAGAALGRHVARMQERIQALRRQGSAQDTSSEELMLQAEQNARANKCDLPDHKVDTSSLAQATEVEFF